MFRIRQSLIPSLALLLLAAAGSVFAQDDATADPPDRVARLAYVSGDVSMAPAGTDDWSVADRNRPLIAGDHVLTGDDGRAALDLGYASVRVSHGTALDFAALDDANVRVELSQGTLNLGVRRIEQGQNYEVDTPTLAFTATQPGSYRIDIAPDGNGAMVTVFSGAGTVWGANDASRGVEAGRSYRFDGADLARVELRDIPAGNDFDRFCADLDAEFARSDSAQYVSDGVIGYDDLDEYGEWQQTSDYGPVWYPTRVAADWAPYRNGHWAYIGPWGWTWIDDAPWGFAPFHYGRWALIGTRWCWVPGPRLHRAVYAPALVAFVGGVSISIGGGMPVGWFPLGPRDMYLPPYRVSQRYFVNINLGGGRYFARNRIDAMYADYHRGRGLDRHDYAYRHNPRAVTAVPRDVFTGARPVARSAARFDEAVLQRAQVALSPHVTPIAASRAATPRGAPPRGVNQAFSRRVVTRTTVTRTAVAPTRSVVPAGGIVRGTPRTATLPSTPTIRSATPRGAPIERREATPQVLPQPRPVTRSTVVRAPHNRSVYTPTPATQPQVLPTQRNDEVVRRPANLPNVQPLRRIEPMRRPEPVQRTEPVRRVETVRSVQPMPRIQPQRSAPMSMPQPQRTAPAMMPAPQVQASGSSGQSGTPRGKPASRTVKSSKSDDKHHH
jgi:hypothetical protein